MIRVAAILLAGVAAWPIVFATRAHPHDAPQGWAYPFACCSGYDCRPVNGKGSSVRVTERAGGFVIGSTGEVLAYTDKRLRDSPDGEFHWCSVAGKDDGKTICLFVPPRSY